MSDKAERVAKLIWDGVYGNGPVPLIVAAIIREEYPEGETPQELDERLATKQALGAGCHDEYGLIVDCYSCGHYTEAVSGCDPIMPKCEGHKYWVRRARPATDVSEAEKALCMDILGERGRSVDEVNRLVTLLIDYREGLKAQAAPDVSALREAAETLKQAREKIQNHLNEIYDAGGVEYIGLGSTLDRIDRTIAALLRSEPKLGGTV